MAKILFSPILLKVSEKYCQLYLIGTSKYFKGYSGKKHPKIKLQRLGKIRKWTFGSLVYQINSF